MMKSQRKNIPLVRVKGFEGAWELCTLGEHIEDYVEKTTVQNQYPVLTSSQNKGIVRQEDYFANRQVTTDSNIGYFVLPKGFFTYRSRSDNGVFKFNRNDLLDKGIISYFYPVFSIVEGDSDFYLKLLNTSITKQVMLQAEGTGQKVLSLSKFKSIKTLVPSLPEQSAIDSLFRTLDDLLSRYKDNLANYQSFKATMLSKMFPKAGHKVPEIRLEGFEGEWEEKQLSKLVKRVTQSSDSDSLPKVEFEDIISGQGRLNKDISSKFDNRKGIHFEPGYTLYGKLRPYLNNWLLPKFEGVALGDFWVFDPNGNDSNFIYYLVQSNRYQKVANDTSGTKMPRSDWKSVSSTIFAIPQTVAEQQAIGSYFSNLDNLINSHQEKISQLETLKKKLLQDMFI